MGPTLALLDRLKSEIPEIWDRAQVVGTWVWLEFRVPPLKEIRVKLKELGFHWNARRKSWQHPCGSEQARPDGDPRRIYQVMSANEAKSKDLPPMKETITAKEFKVVSLRECRVPESMQLCDTPERAAEYWRATVARCPYFNPDCECFVALLLNTRRRIKGHQLISIGTLDTVLVHPREVFRGAIVAAAAAVIIMHNHPSGEPQPSEADIKVTRDLIRAGQFLKLEVIDHVIMGSPKHCSLRELGYFVG